MGFLRETVAPERQDGVKAGGGHERDADILVKVPMEMGDDFRHSTKIGDADIGVKQDHSEISRPIVLVETMSAMISSAERESFQLPASALSRLFLFGAELDLQS